MMHNLYKSIGSVLSLSILSIFNSPTYGSTGNGSFLRDAHNSLERELLEKAVPLSDYGEDVVRTVRRRLSGDSGDGKDSGDGDDDFYLETSYDFNRYSLKYATCQKIQRFSDDAVADYAKSPLVVDNIVVLRLCPQNQCSEKSKWGCTSGYGEYALSLDTYLKIILNSETLKEEQMCNFCQECGFQRRRLDGDDFYAAGDDDESGDQNSADSGDANDVDYYVQEEVNDDDGVDAYCQRLKDDAKAYYQEANNEADAYYQEANDDDKSDQCDDYCSVCMTMDCNNGGNGNGKQIKYNTCEQVKKDDQYYPYYISPHCDKKNQISMGIFSDKYCSYYIGNQVNIQKYADLDVTYAYFDEISSSSCIDCTVSYDPPYFNVPNYLCNKVYQKSGQCNTFLSYAVDSDNDRSTDTSCAFIESIRYGTYDGLGRLSKSSLAKNSPADVTQEQTIFLAVSSFIVVSLALYVFVLHHKLNAMLSKSIQSGLLDTKKVSMSKTKNPFSRKKKKNLAESTASTSISKGVMI